MWLQQTPDAAGEVAFEAAQGFATALALGLLAREVGGCVGDPSGRRCERAVHEHDLGSGSAAQGVVEHVPVGGPVLDSRRRPAVSP